MYNDEKDYILAGVNDRAKKSSKEILKKMSKKKMMKKWKERKARICEKLIFQKGKTLLIGHLYSSVLPMFKYFVLIFEQKSSQVHIFYLEISESTLDN